MISISYYNPITNNKDCLNIEIIKNDYFFWKRQEEYNSDEDLVNILNFILVKLDCTKVFDCGRLCMTNYPKYTNNLSAYYHYLNKLTNQFVYNNYIDILIQRHIDNIIFEYNNPIQPKKVIKKKVKNIFTKATTMDMFTQEIVYVYTNDKTGETIKSSNPNLLEELNNKKKVEKKKSKTKEIGVPISAMTFSFKK